MRHFISLLFLALVSASAFSTGFWNEGIVHLKRGDTLKAPIKYDMINGVVYTIDDGKLKTWSACQVSSFKFIDEITEETRHFETIERRSSGGLMVPVMFEKVYEGKYLVLRRNTDDRERMTVWLQNEGNLNLYTYKVHNFDYFAVDENGEYEAI